MGLQQKVRLFQIRRELFHIRMILGKIRKEIVK